MDEVSTQIEAVSPSNAVVNPRAIRAARIKANVSLADVATVCGVSVVTVRQWEVVVSAHEG